MNTIRPADPAATALDGPGSTTVSCLLMEDTVAADAVSVGPGAGQVGLFANPFLGGKREAVVVDEQGFLTYLRREGSGTGWAQVPVSNAAGPLKAREVVVVVHPRDLTIWAICTSDTELTALRLDGTAVNGEVRCSWQVAPNAFSGEFAKGIAPLRHLYVSYTGRIPYITGIKAREGHIVTISPFIADLRYRFSYKDSGPGTAGGVGTVDDLAAAATGPLPAGICYTRTGKTLTRHDLRDTSKPLAIAPDAAKLVGVYQTAYGFDVGCVYLEEVSGNLVTWTPDWSGDRQGHYTYTSGLGLHTATAWTDANGMLHVYGLDADDTLKVLHQASWDSKGAPIWSSTTSPSSAHQADSADRPAPHPNAAQHAAQHAATVPACVGLVRDVEYVDVDPFPGDVPALLVELRGAATDPERFSVHSLDQAAQRWSRDKIRLPSGNPPKRVSRYVSGVTVLNRRGAPMPGLPISVSADTLVEITVEGVGHLIGPGHPAQLATDALGRITMATAADSLLPATLRVDAAGLEHGAVVQPATAIHEYLAGTGTLASQQGLFDGTALWEATDDKGVPIVDRTKHTKPACDGVADQTAQIFRLAAGKPLVSRRHTGAGPAPEIHGVALGSALSPLTGEDSGRVRYTEYATAEEFQAALAAIEARADFAGAWEDFSAWAGDVWEGIKNGVVTVENVLVGAATTLVVKIGGATVFLKGLVLGAIETAVRVCEAVVAQVVEGTALVVDWLKALFSFKDIWETAQALRGGLTLMLGYGTSAIEHFQHVGAEWILAQKEKVEDAFTALEKGWAGAQIGDPANETPALDDHSGHAVLPRDLSDNPQATWMLDKAMASGTAPEPLPANEHLSDCWKAFETKVEGTAYYQHFQAIKDDLAALLAQITDPGDPMQAAKASATALLDILKNLIDVALQAMHDAFVTAIDLVLAALAYAGDVLAAKLPAGPLNDLYRWIQGEAGIAAADAEDLTIAGLVFLIAAFAVTPAYKLVNGVDAAPFPGGVFPNVAGPSWGVEPGTGAGDDPPSPETLATVKGSMGVIQIVAAGFNAFADIAPATVLPPGAACTSWLVPGINCLLGSTTELALACPSMNGKTYEGPASGAFVSSAILAALSIGTLVKYLQVPVTKRGLSTGALKNYGLVPPGAKQMVPFLGPLVVTGLTAATLTCTLTAGLPPNPYAWGQLMLSSTPGLTQWARVLVNRADDTGWSQIRAYTVGAIDLLAGATAGAMTAAAGLSPRLGIPEQTAEFTLGKDSTYVIARTGEYPFNTPLHWTIKAGGLPAGLTLDSTTGGISGKATATGTAKVTVECTDSYSPPMVVSAPVEVVVNP